MTHVRRAADFKSGAGETQAKLGNQSRGEAGFGHFRFSPDRVKICASTSGASSLNGRCLLPPALRQLNNQMRHVERHADTEGIDGERGVGHD